VAHGFALGGLAQAAQANNDAAIAFMQPILFFRVAEVVIRYMVWLNLLWVIPMMLWWRATTKSRSSRGNEAEVF